jgi:hypothetical protein
MLSVSSRSDGEDQWQQAESDEDPDEEDEAPATVKKMKVVKKKKGVATRDQISAAASVFLQNSCQCLSVLVQAQTSPTSRQAASQTS